MFISMSQKRNLIPSAILILAGLAGCSALFPSDPPAGPLVGSWQFALSGNSLSMTLTTGLTFTEASTFSGASHTYSGTYTSDSTSIVFTSTVVDGSPVAPQVEPADYALSPNSSSMVLTYLSGTPPPLVLVRQ
jgi:hypothetical protein